MMLVKASSTARVTERQSEAEKPGVSVRRSKAPRTTERSFGSLEIWRAKSKPLAGSARLLARRERLGRWALMGARIRRRRPSLGWKSGTLGRGTIGETGRW